MASLLTRDTLTIETSGRGTNELTARVQGIVRDSGVHEGLCHVFVHHTSASLMLCENADPQVLRDLERFMQRQVPDGDPLFEHTAEGPDDMPAHVRSVLTQSGISIPVLARRCALGTWQGIYLWEHRHAPHQRQITVTVHGHGHDDTHVDSAAQSRRD
ncbi:MAG: secondary thiamine-phosphate synthase enzyme [Gammaproteobacteria bacterium]|jgi:secondary thiamine-phosphate synthase enzyme